MIKCEQRPRDRRFKILRFNPCNKKAKYRCFECGDYYCERCYGRFGGGCAHCRPPELELINDE